MSLIAEEYFKNNIINNKYYDKNDMNYYLFDLFYKQFNEYLYIDFSNLYDKTTYKTLNNYKGDYEQYKEDIKKNNNVKEEEYFKWKNITYIPYIKEEYEDLDIKKIIEQIKDEYEDENIYISTVKDIIITPKFYKLKNLVIDYYRESAQLYIDNPTVESIFCKSEINFINECSKLKKLTTCLFDDNIKNLKLKELILFDYETDLDSSISDVEINMKTLKSFTYFIFDIYDNVIINTSLNNLYIWLAKDVIINQPINKVIIIGCNNLIINAPVKNLLYVNIKNINDIKNINMKKIFDIPYKFKTIYQYNSKYFKNIIKDEFNKCLNEN